MPDLSSTRVRPARSRPWAWRAVLLGVAVVALLARLVPLLRGGGLTGLGNYDDGVYYAAGTALAHGRLPYADFLLLHPPGIVLALAPFGLLARLAGDPAGLAAARLAWTGLGAVNALLVTRLLRGQGRVVAALGGAAYALAYPAIYSEWTPLLEAPPTTCVLLALVLLARHEPAPATSGTRAFRAWLPVLLAGALVGLSATVKIWGAATVVAVVAWFLLRGRFRTGLLVLAGAAAAVTAVCLPFFLAAPGTMWRMVVLDQLVRGRSSTPAVPRLADIVGLGWHHAATRGTPLLVLVVVVVALVVAALVVGFVAAGATRLAAVLAVVHCGVLLAGPSWFLHYPAFAVGPLVVATFAGLGEVARRAGTLHPRLRTGLLVLVAAVVVAQASPLAHLRLGTRFPGASLGRAVAIAPGCVSSDDPLALAAMDVLGRDLDRGCPFVADLGGYSYELTRERGRPTPRPRDQAWQQTYLAQLRTGTTTLAFRYAGVWSAATRATVDRWPVVAGAGPYRLRTPARP